MIDLELDLLCLSNGTRLRILKLLFERRQMISSMIAILLNQRTSVVSHHLRKLEAKGFIVGVKSGVYVIYYPVLKRYQGVIDALEKIKNTDSNCASVKDEGIEE